MSASSSISEPIESVFLLGLGSNMGDRLSYLLYALKELDTEAGRVTAKSSVWETEPWGFEAEEHFLNMVIEFTTALDPDALLDVIKSIEARLGRTRTKGPGYRSRVIDIDILLWGDRVISGPGLKIPHPRIAERRFVLVPLCEIAPYNIHPVRGRSLIELLGECDDRSEVRLFTQAV
jgi:2-amino-4-hydroxy-6-hydroxymethyldihydropteridine diphosphokinase